MNRAAEEPKKDSHARSHAQPENPVGEQPQFQHWRVDAQLPPYESRYEDHNRNCADDDRR